MSEKKTLKILIVRFSSIGDIVLTTPVIRCLKLQTNVEIHYLTKQNFQSILADNPYIDQLWTIKNSISEIQKSLQMERFDYIIDLHKNLRTLHLRWILNTKVLAFHKLNFQKWLITKFKINRLPKTHIVDRYLATVAALNIKNDGRGLDYFIPKKDEIDLGIYYLSMDYQRPMIAFVIGAAHATKRLPLEKIIEICQKITQNIVLLGGAEDAKNGIVIAQTAGSHVLNLCGQLNLNQSASVLRQADKVITHDTGLMHIAAAFQKEILSVWGNTIPEFGMYPYLDATKFSIVEVKNLPCRPCSKIGYQQCPKGHFKCMQMIDIEEITA